MCNEKQNRMARYGEVVVICDVIRCLARERGTHKHTFEGTVRTQVYQTSKLN